MNIGFITYFFDIEQLTVAKDAIDFTHYPAWPPRPIVDLVHWYGHHYDPLLMARPPFCRATIWIDVVAFGPFYAAAIYAFIRGRDWIRVPALVWAGMMMANVMIILFEERYGRVATPHFGMVLAVNLPWLLLPLAIIWRLCRDQPFVRPVPRHRPRPAEATVTEGRMTRDVPGTGHGRWSPGPRRVSVPRSPPRWPSVA